MEPAFSLSIEKILALAGKEGSRPLDLLARGPGLEAGAKAVAKSSHPPQVKGALYLYFDAYDQAHDIANAHEGTAAGNWIHAIVHRREPDASNSKYWYARVELPEKVKGEISGEIRGLKCPEIIREWKPRTFVDLCEKNRKKSPEDAVYRVLARIQEIEWKVLIKYILAQS